jgi:hypothetical protein
MNEEILSPSQLVQTPFAPVVVIVDATTSLIRKPTRRSAFPRGLGVNKQLAKCPDKQVLKGGLVRRTRRKRSRTLQSPELAIPAGVGHPEGVSNL